jgi:histone chaperone ASF1
VFQAPPPDHNKIRPQDLLEVTVILLTCSYRDKEFIRIGYFVNNQYQGDPSELTPGKLPDVSKVIRILSAEPRVTRKEHHWDAVAPVVASTSSFTTTNNNNNSQQQQQQQQTGNSSTQQSTSNLANMAMDEEEDEEIDLETLEEEDERNGLTMDENEDMYQ